VNSDANGISRRSGRRVRPTRWTPGLACSPCIPVPGQQYDYSQRGTQPTLNRYRRLFPKRVICDCFLQLSSGPKPDYSDAFSGSSSLRRLRLRTVDHRVVTRRAVAENASTLADSPLRLALPLRWRHPQLNIRGAIFPLELLQGPFRVLAT